MTQKELRYCIIKISLSLLLIALLLRLRLTGSPESFVIPEAAAAESFSDSAYAPTVAGTYTYSGLYPELYASSDGIPSSLPKEKKIAYITFDDGPSCLTGEILALLEKENIKATFFVVAKGLSDPNGEAAERLKAIAAAGHTIGIHTYTHDYEKIYSSVQNYLDDFYKAYTLIKDTAGIAPNIFRFPGGSNNVFITDMQTRIIDEMSRRGFTYYDWNVSAEDAVGKPTRASIKKNLETAYKYSFPVLLMHDASYNGKMLKVLPEIIHTLKDKGYTFDTLDNRVPIHFN